MFAKCLRIINNIVSPVQYGVVVAVCSRSLSSGVRRWRTVGQMSITCTCSSTLRQRGRMRRLGRVAPSFQRGASYSLVARRELPHGHTTALHPAPPRDSRWFSTVASGCVALSGETAMPLKSPVLPRGHGARAPPRPRLGILRGFHPQVLAHLLASWAEHALRAKARRGARRRLLARGGRAGTGARQGHSQVAVCAAPDHGGGRRDGRYGQGI